MSSTRNSTICPVVGQPQELDRRRLPTCEDVMKHCLYVRQNLTKGNKLPPVNEVFGIVASDLLVLWDTASIPAISKNGILYLLKTNYEKQRNLLKSQNSKKITRSTFENNLDKFKEQCKRKLFDISACKCTSFKSCSCTKEKRVPEEERDFLNYQRIERKMVIAGIDKKTSSRREKTHLRRLLDERQLTDCDTILNEVVLLSGTSSSAESDASEYEPCSSTKRRFEANDNDGESKIKMRKVALLADKTGVSDRAVATIASAVLEGANIIDKDDNKGVIDRNKVRRAKNRARRDLQFESKVIDPLQSIYFDGRKDATRIKDESNHVKITKEENISIIQEPGSHYVCHVTPIMGTARCVSSTIMDFFKSNDIDKSKVVAIGCDGTAVNTGQKRGIIKLIEEKLCAPVHWFVCLLHTNELPLRHLIQAIDGKTSGPSSYNGEIGKNLQDCERKDVEKFLPVEGDPINIDPNNLSCDQKYLLMIYKAVSSGVCPEELQQMNPGTMHHARWLTTANRFLRFYISCDKPSDDLLILVQYIMKVYAPVWFSVKEHPSAKDGAKHFYQLIKRSRFLPDKYNNIVNMIISHNSYFAHSENILLAMLNDDSAAIRELAVRRIVKARSESDATELRRMTLPKLLFDASSYHMMIDWQQTQLTEPPATRQLQLEHMEKVVIEEKGFLQLTDFVCHTQAVERMIKMVTEASCTVVGEEARDGMIRAKLEGRKLLPSFEMKKDFIMEE